MKFKKALAGIFLVIGLLSTMQAKGQSPFISEWIYGGSDYAYYSILADFDGDGALDIASSHFSGPGAGVSTVGIKRGNGDGTFQGSEFYKVGVGALGISAGDLNNDGWPDLAVACYSQNTMEVLFNDGTGRFVHAGVYPAGLAPYGLKLADFNLDGYLDVAMVAEYSDSLHVWLNNGDGTFGGSTDYVAGFHASELAVGDLNGDSYPDIVTTNYREETIGVFLNNQDGTLAAMVTYPAQVNGFGIVLDDVDGNATLDAIVANTGSTVSIFPGNGDGTFGERVDYDAGPTPAGIAYLDFDNDGLKDILVSNDYSDGYTLLRGSTGFTSPETFTLTGTPYVFATGDVDGDGLLDVVMPLRDTVNICVMLQADLAPNVVSGVATVEDLTTFGTKIATFTFRDGSSEFTRTTRLNADGSFIFAGIPAAAYELHIKAVTTLAENVAVDTTAGSVTGVTAFLKSGDGDESNSIDVLDLDVLIQAFDTVPGFPNFNPNTDFNGDDSVDVLDLDILLRNFDQEGAP